jgi:hypothetical protein
VCRKLIRSRVKEGGATMRSLYGNSMTSPTIPGRTARSQIRWLAITCQKAHLEQGKSIEMNGAGGGNRTHRPN